MILRVVLVGLMLLHASCGPDAAHPGCLDAVAVASDGAYVDTVTRVGQTLHITYTDGRKVAVPSPPSRVVSTLPGITEAVVALGARASLVGVSPHCDYPPEVAFVGRLSVQPLDRETLMELRPDLVLADGVVHVDGLESLGPDGPAVLTLESRSVAHVARTMRLLAEVFDTAEAREAATAFGSDLAQLRREIAASPLAAPRVLLLAESDPLFVLGPGSLLDDMLRACGAVNVACDLGRASGPFSEELVLARRPDWIVALDGMPDARVLDRWASLPAVREGRVASGAADDLLRAGPRSVAALRRFWDVLRGRRLPETLEGQR